MNETLDQNLHYRAWQEAGRQADIQGFASALFALLRSQISLRSLSLYEFIENRHELLMVASATTGRENVTEQSAVYCTGTQALALSKWIAGAQFEPASATSIERCGLAGIRAAHAESALIGGLGNAQGAQGLLVLEVSDRRSSDPELLFWLAGFLEPCAIALQNAQRLRALGAQAKSAEADKLGLLGKLGRDEIVDSVVGLEGGLREIYTRIERVCDSDLPILILGETGTGKEVLSREIHQRSSRANGPFIRVNCGAIPPELIDSELFGHEKGSFTGATAQRRGWFERAHGGSLLLDEVGELTPAAQVRLLRVMQDGVLQRVGGEAEFAVDVRVIAATHRDLPAMIREGGFRQDLWYRLAGFPIELPPLRARRQDIPALAKHFVARAARRFGLRAGALDASALRLLEDYPWPGNIREFAAVIDRAVILGGGERLDIAQALGSAMMSIPDQPLSTPSAPSAPSADDQTLLTLDEAMAKHIEHALNRTQGRIDGPHGAARLLKINSHTLRARMRKLGVDWAKYKAE